MPAIIVSLLVAALVALSPPARAGRRPNAAVELSVGHLLVPAVELVEIFAAGKARDRS